MLLPDAALTALRDGVANGATTGGVAAIIDSDGLQDVSAAGALRHGGEPVTTATRFDLASLTKVLATLPCVLRLVDEGQLSLEQHVGQHFSNAGWCQAPSLADATVWQLLTHTAGLPAWEPFFARVSDRSTALAALLLSQLREPGKMVYSDAGFMLLGALVERVRRRRLDAVARELVFEPLGMGATSYGPIDEPDVAVTEDCGWRGRLLKGEVHDENATVWDGVAGHAGLFGDASDLASYAAAWLRLDPVLGSPELLREAISPQVSGDDGSVRGLGWLLAHPGVFAGSGSRGFGHTGFTGTSMWVDPEAGVASVLLTNCVHPHRSRREGIIALRRSFHSRAHGVIA